MRTALRMGSSRRTVRREEGQASAGQWPPLDVGAAARASAGPVAGLVTLTVPYKHAHDWYDRCGVNYADAGDGTELVDTSARTVTLTLSTAALRDLRSDAELYAECMGPSDTGDLDYRPAARRCLAALDRQFDPAIG